MPSLTGQVRSCGRGLA